MEIILKQLYNYNIYILSLYNTKDCCLVTEQKIVFNSLDKFFTLIIRKVAMKIYCHSRDI